MAVDREYLEYVGFFCISILSASAAYLINLDNPVTYVGFLIIPMAFGYSAYVSRNGFKKSSMASLMTLFLVLSKPVVAVVAIIIALGVPLVSIFSNGDSFKDYFGSVGVPLLILGLMLGAGIYGVMQYDDERRQAFTGFMADTAGEQTENALEMTGMGGNVKDKQIEAMKSTSEATVLQTSQVLSANMTTLNSTQRMRMRDSLDYARNTVPDRVADQLEESTNSTQIDVSEKVSEQIESRFSDKYLLALIPLVAMVFYSVRPFVGFLTGLFAVLAGYISEKSGL